MRAYQKAMVVGVALLAMSACSSSGNSGRQSTTTASTPSSSGGTTPNSQASTTTAKPGEPLNIALVVDQTGVSAEIANPTAAGIQARVEQINASGGVGGRPIKILKVVDSASTAAGAQVAFQDVVQQKPLAILGSVNSLGISAAPPIVGPAGIPVIIGSAPDTLLTPTPQPWLFVMNMTASAQLQVSLDFVNQKLGSLAGKRIAVAAASSAFGDGYVAAFRDAAKTRGFTEAIVDRHALDMASFATNAAQITAAKPDAVLLLDVPSKTPMIVSDLAAAGYSGPVVGYAATSEPTIITAVASAQFFTFRGVPVPTPGDDLTKAATAAGVADKAKSFWFSYGWNEVSLLAEAAKACGADCNSAKIMSGLEGVTGLAPAGGSSFGPLSFGPKKHFADSVVQFFTYDPSTKAVVTSGSPVKLPG